MGVRMVLLAVVLELEMNCFPSRFADSVVFAWRDVASQEFGILHLETYLSLRGKSPSLAPFPSASFPSLSRLLEASRY
jgi:hypothetical protein